MLLSTAFFLKRGTSKQFILRTNNICSEQCKFFVWARVLHRLKQNWNAHQKNIKRYGKMCIKFCKCRVTFFFFSSINNNLKSNQFLKMLNDVLCVRGSQFQSVLMGISCFRVTNITSQAFSKGISNEKEHAHFILPITTHFSSLLRQTFQHPFTTPTAPLLH